jgi:glycerate kinase
VLIAPDSFTGTLSAPEAAAAMAEGWRSVAPTDDLHLAPLSDGGPGFLDVVAHALGGELNALTVTGPLGDPVPAAVLHVGDTAYVESAQACGLHLIPLERRDPTVTTTYGVGELLAAAVGSGARRIVVGLGGSGTNDAGAGALAALGAEPAAVLRAGGAALGGLPPERLDLSAARARLEGVEVLVATDVDAVLLGLRGASAGYGPQKGADPDAVQRLDAALEHFARAAQPGVGLNMTGSLAVAPGAGAAGGTGYGLLLLGGRRVPGIATVMALTGLEQEISRAEVVLTGEGCLDWQSLTGKVVSGVATAATQFGVPCVVLAGRVEVGRREVAALGVASAYAIDDLVGTGWANPAESLSALAARVASNWSHSAM